MEELDSPIMSDSDDEDFKCKTEHICVIDFEATCVEDNKDKFYPHEIIEFPAALVNGETGCIIDTFHSYVKPTINPQLSNFCKKLTGISQETVDKAETFDIVFPQFLEWLYLYSDEGCFTILTDGPWDMSKFLYLQCLISHIKFPAWAERFIDIKLTFKTYNRRKEKPKLMDMLEFYGLKFKGHLHSGRDDTLNIAVLVKAMLNSNCYFSCNAEVIPENKTYLEHKFVGYLRRKQREEKAKKREANNRKKTNRKNVHLIEDLDVEFSSVMDIDPDLVDTEKVLTKYKSK